MNESSKELMHWSLGEKARKHKYIFREKGKRPGVFRYFYDLDSYNAWKNKGTTKKNYLPDIKSKPFSKTTSKAKEKLDRFKESWKTGAKTIRNFGNEYKKLWKSGKKTIDESKKDAIATSKKWVPKKYTEVEVKTGGSGWQKTVTTGIEFLNKKIPLFDTTETMGNYVPYVPKEAPDKKSDSFARNYNDIHVSDVVKMPPRKVVETVTLPDGQVRHFYDQETADEWNKMQYFQENEHENMKDLKNIIPNIDGSLPSEEETIAKVNPLYGKDDDASVNCAYCSMVYDLRKKGYDVSMKAIDSDLKTAKNFSGFYDGLVVKQDQQIHSAADKAFENKIIDYMAEQSKAGELTSKWAYVTKLLNDSDQMYYDYYYDKNGNTKSITPLTMAKDVSKTMDSHVSTEAVIKKCFENDKAYAEAAKISITTQINDYPNGSWGVINVYWEPKGGHAFNFEKTSSGDIVFIDGQTGRKVDLMDYLNAGLEKTGTIQLVRTDNLKPSGMIHNYVVDNNGETNKYSH